MIAILARIVAIENNVLADGKRDVPDGSLRLKQNRCYSLKMSDYAREEVPWLTVDTGVRLSASPLFENFEFPAVVE